MHHASRNDHRRTGEPRWRTAAGAAAALCVMVGLALLAGGCGSGPAPQSAPVIPGFLGLGEDLAAVDTSPLRGRRILLDPGHGGLFRGALGPNGLTEAEVNLGVALYLRGMLEAAGAEVPMTRTTDRDFLAGTDSTVAADLAFRVSLCDSLQPDVFVSIHHNSNPAYDPVINETQTYYPIGDEGPSVELARAIHRHLAVNLEIRPARLLPGNFHVLRNVSVPAVLGEPAMISNPVMAGRLTLARSHRLEAAAYFLGLREYFAGGRPRWLAAGPDTIAVPVDGPAPVLAWTFQADDRPGAAPGPDPTSFVLLEDGRPVPFDLSEDALTVRRRPDWDGRPLELRLMGRNLEGRTTPVLATVLRPVVSCPWRVEVVRESGPAPRRMRVGWSAAAGIDGPAGRFRWPGGREVVVASGSGGSMLIEDPSISGPVGPATWIPGDGSAQAECPVAESTLAEGLRWAALQVPGPIPLDPIPPDPIPLHSIPWRSRLAEGGFVSAPGALAYDPGRPLWLEAPGWLPLVRFEPGTSGPGDGVPPLETVPVLPALQGLTVVLDARGGGTETDGATPLGARGSDLNLEAVRQAERILTGAGARVLVTRGGDEPLSDPAKVLLAKQAAADLFLVLGRSRGPGRYAVRHYPGSSAGRAWAAAAAQALAPLTAAGDSVTIGPGSDYLLRHTHCPALVVEAPLPTDERLEVSYASLERARAEAAALLLGTGGYLAPGDAPPPQVDPAAVIAAVPGLAGAGALRHAVWDGQFLWAPPGGSDGPVGPDAPDSLSSGTATRWPAYGPRHTLEIQTRQGWQLWSLEGTPGRWRCERLAGS